MLVVTNKKTLVFEMCGRKNVAVGFFALGLFMLHGFLLVYFRDFSSMKEAWEDSYGAGRHLQERMAHVHGGLFALLNIVIGYFLLRLQYQLTNISAISWLALVGMCMPLGILAYLYLGLPPFLVLVGAACMVISVIWLGISFVRAKSIYL